MAVCKPFDVADPARSSLNTGRTAPREVPHLPEGRHGRVAWEGREQRAVRPAEIDCGLRLLTSQQAVEESRCEAVPTADAV